MDAMAPRIGRYELRGTMGQGGWSTIYLAWDTRLRREVALKALLEQYRTDPALRRRLVEEGCLLAGLRHPNIVAVYDVEDQEAGSFYTMELIDGASAAQRVADGHGLPLPQVVTIVNGIAAALDYLHGQRYVHADVKPANTLLDPSGRVVLIDFGLARPVGDAPGGGVSGTPPYIAPEVVLGEAPGAAADIYALGTMAYALLAGRPPFLADPGAPFNAQLNQDPPLLRTFRPDLPDAMSSTVATTLARLPWQRPARAGLFAVAFAAASRTQPTSLTGPWAGAPGLIPMTGAAMPAQPQAPTGSATVSVPPVSGTGAQPAYARPPGGPISPPTVRQGPVAFPATSDDASEAPIVVPPAPAPAPPGSAYPPSARRDTPTWQTLPGDPAPMPHSVPSPEFAPPTPPVAFPPMPPPPSVPYPGASGPLPTGARPSLIARLRGLGRRGAPRPPKSRSAPRPAPARDGSPPLAHAPPSIPAAPPAAVPPQSVDAPAGIQLSSTVFAPAAVAPAESFLVQVFAHLPERSAEAAALATEFDNAAQRRGFAGMESLISPGERLQFALNLPGIAIDNPVQSMFWRNQTQSVQFGATVPADHAPATIVGTVTISRDNVPIGHIKFKLTVQHAAANAVAAAPVEAATGMHMYHRAFISYASSDRREVLKRTQMLERMKIEFFQDVLSLEPGDRWEQELYRHIDACDLFLLFWSTAAKQSPWVMKEVTYALHRKGGDETAPPEVLPVIIEGPPLVPPPPELAHLHFNDRLLYFMQ